MSIIKLPILLLLFCLLFLAAPVIAAGGEENFTAVQFASSDTATYKDLPPVDVFAQNMNTVLGAKDVSASATEKAEAIRLGTPEIVRPVMLEMKPNRCPLKPRQ